MKYSELTNFQKEYKRYTVVGGLDDLTPAEYALYSSGFVVKSDAPYSEWMALYSLRDKIDNLVKSDIADIEPYAEIQVRPTAYVISDSLDGVLNHANGKVYDSKSKYYADLKASGHVIVESGMDKPSQTRGDFDARKDIAKALNQLGY